MSKILEGKILFLSFIVTKRMIFILDINILIEKPPILSKNIHSKCETLGMLAERMILNGLKYQKLKVKSIILCHKLLIYDQKI